MVQEFAERPAIPSKGVLVLFGSLRKACWTQAVSTGSQLSTPRVRPGPWCTREQQWGTQQCLVGLGLRRQIRRQGGWVAQGRKGTSSESF